MRKISAAKMQDYLVNLHSEGKAKSTINKRKIVLQQIFRFILLQENGPKVQNPCGLLYTPRTAKVVERRALTENEIESVIAYRAASMIGFYAFCLLFLGLRRSEMLGIMWEDLDLENGMLHLQRTILYRRNHPCVCEVLKNGSRGRIVPIPNILLCELKQQKKKNCGYLFANERGELPLESQLRNMWNTYCQKTGMDITQHMARHTYASMLYAADVDLKATATVMGHKTEKTTSKIYTHLDRQRTAQKVAIKLNSYIEDSRKL